MTTTPDWAINRGSPPFYPAEAARLYPACPERFIQALDRYVNFGIATGGFLRAVLENDLGEAVGRADDESLMALRPIYGVVFNCIPDPAHGSKEAVAAWLKREPRA